ncbi:MAG: hypothetical protein WD512_00640, partial [Candidatus Paceibacterota bacterium]
MDIAFYVIYADHSDKCNKIIDTLNNLVDMCPYDNIILFNSQYNRTDAVKKFPIIHLNQAKYFRGILICFDIKSSMITKTFPAPEKQILYIDETSWSNDSTIPMMFWQGIYSNPDIKLVAKNEEIKDLLSICWSE